MQQNKNHLNYIQPGKYINKPVWLFTHQMMFPGGVGEEKTMTLMSFTPLQNGRLITFKKCIHETGKTGFFNLNIEGKWKQVTSLLWWFSLEFVFIYSFFLMLWEINSKEKIFTRVKKEKIKSSRNEYVFIQGLKCLKILFLVIFKKVKSIFCWEHNKKGSV